MASFQIAKKGAQVLADSDDSILHHSIEAFPVNSPTDIIRFFLNRLTLRHPRQLISQLAS